MFRHKSRECVGNIEVDSIPSIKEVYNGEYAYRPCPPDIGKYPVHPQVFMHSFFEPGDHTGSAVINRLPKKLHGELSCAVDLGSLPVGWGVYIVEGFNWGLIRIFVVGAVVVTLLLTVIWSTVMQDVQGGTGIGQYSAAIIAIVVTITLLGKTQWENV